VPDLIFVRPRFDAYKAISLQIREIFAECTPIIEPLSLDEAYLDVTESLRGIVSATQIAKEIRAKIRAETGLTASVDAVQCAVEVQRGMIGREPNVPEGSRPPRRHPSAANTRPRRRQGLRRGDGSRPWPERPLVEKFECGFTIAQLAEFS
jgi:hypothetical protein